MESSQDLKHNTKFKKAKNIIRLCILYFVDWVIE